MVIPVKKQSANRLSETNRWFALGAVVGPVFFALVYTILGLVRPGYSLVSEPISGLGVGPNALAMNISFVIMGVLVFLGVLGIFRNMGELGTAVRGISIVLFGLSPIGCILCGLYTYETFLLHFIGFFLACGTPVIGYLVVGFAFRRIPNYRRIGNWMIAGSPLTLVLMVLFLLTFDYLNTDTGIAGLIERLLIIEVQAYYAILGWFIFRR